MRGPISNNVIGPRFPVNLHQGLYLYVLDNPRADYTLARGPIRNKFIRPRFPVNLHQGLYLYVLDKPRVDYTLARAPLYAGPNWEQLVQLA